MKIDHAKIHNYRSIGDLDLRASSLIVLLGPNNHGKSNILGAIEFVLSTSAKVEKEDFFAFRDAGDNKLWVEITFNDLTADERTTFAKYIRSDGSLRIRKAATFDEHNAINVIYRGYIQEAEPWWLKESAADRLSSRETIQAELASCPQLAPLLEGTGRITNAKVE